MRFRCYRVPHPLQDIDADLFEQTTARNRLVELQSELLQASRLSTMGQMAAAITHELNQPLGAVDSYLSGLARLLSATDTAPSVADGLSKAREQTTRAGEIARRMHDLAVTGETARQVEDINDVLEHTLRLALIDVKIRGITTRIMLAPVPTPVLVNRVQFGQVILNIIRNAIEAMAGAAERSLTISTATDPDSHAIEIRIADTGPGL